MTEKNYTESILKFMSNRKGKNVRPRKLARMMGISERDYGDFRAAYKKLRDSGRLVMGAKNAIALPGSTGTLEGRFSSNPRGFGFISPLEPDSRGDLFVPPDKTAGAMNGDLVVARVKKQGKRGGRMRYAGEIVEIKERASSRCVGTLELTDGFWFLLPDGRSFTTPVIVRDVPSHIRKPGTKAVVEITEYPDESGELPAGVIEEILGEAGVPAVEILAVMRAYNLPERFPERVLDEAGRTARGFSGDREKTRRDLAGLTVVTIDPETARDFDDAISLEEKENGAVTLGVHIADVSSFVKPDSPVDEEAYRRGTSVYFPRKVVPMLPEALSNGVCSLQEGQRRFVKSAFITYDSKGEPLSAELANCAITSAKRLTYEEAQDICDGKTKGFPKKVVALVQAMERLARIIEKRRERRGMLHLDLPEIELDLDDGGAVTGTRPADTSYTHKIIEMFMVEANEAVARTLTAAELPVIRRIHPDPGAEAFEQLGEFVRACGCKLPPNPSRADLQRLVDDVRGKPESYAINLAMLRSFEKATYSPEEVGHFALASSNYCHFTSPIRRYPDLEVHRMVDRYIEGARDVDEKEVKALAEKADFLSSRERTAAAAEMEVRLVLVLQHLKTRMGEDFEGVVTGVAEMGLFVQLGQFMVDGLVRLQNLGDDWWEIDARRGRVRGDVSGRVYKLGQKVKVRIASVDVALRQMDLAIVEESRPEKKKRKRRRPSGLSNG